MPLQLAQELCSRLSQRDTNGFWQSSIPSVMILRYSNLSSVKPQTLDGGLLFVLQGGLSCHTGKEGWRVSDRTFAIVPDEFSIHGSDSSKHSETIALFVKFEWLEINRLIKLVEFSEVDAPSDIRRVGRVIMAELTADILDALQDLLLILQSNRDAAALGNASLTKLFYAVLQGPEGYLLASVAQENGRLAKIANAVRYMEKNLSKKFAIGELASQVGMSESSFYRAFREVTDMSPVQYLKKLRLTRAKFLLQYEEKSVLATSIDVGYESATQFSREFKRAFGVPPAHASSLPHTALEGSGKGSFSSEFSMQVRDAELPD